MRIKIDDKIYRLKEIESGVDSLMELVEEPKYKNGDFVYEDGRIMIVKSYPNIYHANSWPIYSDMLSYNGAYAANFSEPTFRYATAEEKQELIELLRKDGKRWNAEKKCIEDTPIYNDGDFVVSKFGSILIFKEADGGRTFDHAYLPVYGELVIDKVAGYYGVKRHATTEEKQRMIDALAEQGKRWNDDKKCVEDIPKRKFKVCDVVRIKDGISSKTHGNIKPIFTPGMDAYIGRRLTVKEYIGNGRVIFSEDIYGPIFDEDWLEPWSDEPKKGDLAIFWDNDTSYAIIRVYDRKDYNRYYDILGNTWKNAIKFESKEQFKKVMKGKL
ncbi:hypothetical protein [Proteiniphilum sp. UBA5463]|mgnify:CR=1 FL=1|jgi:hypothetical protein|uniref:hypothetical protein n=1 Tax=Proteiniphilum sp. UBA5463 TaxID=1947281 RepID=UPI00257FFB08|nr:hypothetical protein [Proteiniphilum sp. UBA5463]